MKEKKNNDKMCWCFILLVCFVIFLTLIIIYDESKNNLKSAIDCDGITETGGNSNIHKQ